MADNTPLKGALTLHEDLDSLKKQICDLKCEDQSGIEQVKTRVETVQTQVKQLLEEIGKLEDEKTAVEKRVVNLENTVESLKKENVNLRDAVKSLKKENVNLRDAVKSLKEQEKNLEAEVEILKTEVKQLLAENGKLEGEKLALDEKVENLEDTVESLKKSVKNLNQENVNLGDAVKSLKEGNVSLNQENVNLRDAVKSLKEGNVSLNQENVNLGDAVKSLKNEVAQLKGSGDELLLGQLCGWIQSTIFKKVLPPYAYNKNVGYKLYRIKEEIDLLENEDIEHSKVLWARLQHDLSLSEWDVKILAKAMRDTQSQRNYSTHPELTEQKLFESANRMNDKGELKTSYENIIKLIGLWKTLEKME